MKAFIFLLVQVIILNPDKLFTLGNNETLENPLVYTTLGPIQGTILKTLYGQDIYAFRGIPYAKPPLQELRFKAPEPVAGWQNTFNATNDGLLCPQPRNLEIAMSEDCLKLNVYSSNLTARNPVMVYIHGGGNIIGSGHSLYEAGPQYLLDYEVVLVAFNYRLGPFGFLSTNSSLYSGNYGYLDQVLALKWVQQHISRFGGDPNNVTIFGMSAGSMAVTLHLASPLSKGLFHKAIAMSGSATNHYDIDNLYWTRKLAKEIDCPQYNEVDMVECLREAKWQTIIDKCAEWSDYGFINMKWNYAIDGYFLHEHPTELFRKGNFSRVPLIVGFTLNEFDFGVYHQENNTRLLHDISENFDKYFPDLFLYQNSMDKKLKSQKLWNFYLTNHTLINSTNLQQFGHIFADGIIGHAIHRLVQLVSKFQPVYYYRMDYIGRRSLRLDALGNPRGVAHADDLQYVMPSTWYGTQFPIDDPDIFMVKRLTQLWTSFAKNGVPVAHDVADWRPVKTTNNLVLANDRMHYYIRAPYQQRYMLWDELFPLSKSSTKCNLANPLAIIIAIIQIFITLIYKR